MSSPGPAEILRDCGALSIVPFMLERAAKTREIETILRNHPFKFDDVNDVLHTWKQNCAEASSVYLEVSLLNLNLVYTSGHWKILHNVEIPWQGIARPRREIESWKTQCKILACKATQLSFALDLDAARRPILCCWLLQCQSQQEYPQLKCSYSPVFILAHCDVRSDKILKCQEIKCFRREFLLIFNIGSSYRTLRNRYDWIMLKASIPSSWERWSSMPLVLYVQVAGYQERY